MPSGKKKRKVDDSVAVPAPQQAKGNRIKDIRLAVQGNANIKLAERNMYALVKLRERYAADKPFDGLKISINLHVTKETAVLVKTLLAGGASVAITGCNSFSTQDEIAASLAEVGCTVHAIHGCSNDEYRSFLDAMVAFHPDLIIDDGGDLTVQAHKDATPEMLAKIIGACEQTTSGVLRMKNMTTAGSLKCPLITTNDNKTKHLLDNYYGTGQSCWDGIMRATSLFVAGKIAVCVGYGECGKGIALRAKGLGASVIVTEVDAFAALRATYDGFAVMPIIEAAEKGDFFITATSNKHAIDLDAIKAMKDGAVLSNAGQFDYEIDVKGLRKLATSTVTVRENMEEITLPSGKCVFLLGGGNLLNLSCAEGHPSEVMTTSFLGQALACEYLVENKGKLAPGVTALPPALDNQIAAMQLDALGVSYDVMTVAQEAYMTSWEEGTD